MDSWRKVPWLSLNSAKEEIGELITNLEVEKDPRKRLKAARRLAFAGSSLAFCKEPLDIETIETGTAALRMARRHGAVTDDLNRSVAWLSKLKLEVSGNANFVVLSERKKRISVDAACLAATGQSELDDDWAAAPRPVLLAMNRGDFFLTSIGADGHCAIVVRLIDTADPILKASEYKHLEASTEVGMVRIENSELKFGAPEDLSNALSVPVPNGMLKVQIHYLERPRSCSFILVACATDQAPDPLIDIPEIR